MLFCLASFLFAFSLPLIELHMIRDFILVGVYANDDNDNDDNTSRQNEKNANLLFIFFNNLLNKKTFNQFQLQFIPDYGF